MIKYVHVVKRLGKIMDSSKNERCRNITGIDLISANILALSFAKTRNPSQEQVSFFVLLELCLEIHRKEMRGVRW